MKQFLKKVLLGLLAIVTLFNFTMSASESEAKIVATQKENLIENINELDPEEANKIATSDTDSLDSLRKFINKRISEVSRSATQRPYRTQEDIKAQMAAIQEQIAEETLGESFNVISSRIAEATKQIANPQTKAKIVREYRKTLHNLTKTEQ